MATLTIDFFNGQDQAEEENALRPAGFTSYAQLIHNLEMIQSDDDFLGEIMEQDGLAVEVARVLLDIAANVSPGATRLDPEAIQKILAMATKVNKATWQSAADVTQ